MSRLCHFLCGLNVTIMTLPGWVRCHDYDTFGMGEMSRLCHFLGG